MTMMTRRVRRPGRAQSTTAETEAGSDTTVATTAETEATETTVADETTTTVATVEATVVDVIGADYSFDTGGVTEVPAGAVTISLTNEGAEEHQAGIMRLNDGVTFRTSPPPPTPTSAPRWRSCRSTAARTPSPRRDGVGHDVRRAR